MWDQTYLSVEGSLMGVTDCEARSEAEYDIVDDVRRASLK
jgi:hypothetical protein